MRTQERTLKAGQHPKSKKNLESGSRRPNIAVVVDCPDWAHDLKAKQLARVLGNEFRIGIFYQDKIVPGDFADADLVLIYYWYQILELQKLGFCFDGLKRKPLIGICSHFELNGQSRNRGLEILNKTAGAVFANNLRLYREFRPYLFPPLFYTPNGVDTEFFRPREDRSRSSSQELRVGWAGSLTNVGRDHRGVGQFIAPAVSEVKGTVLVTAIREEKWRSREEMRDFYHSLDVYICASESEGTPNPCLEAAACGIPIVSTAVGNMPEFIRDGENGFLVERDVKAIADSLRQLKKDRTQRSSMGQMARLAAEKWSWDLKADHYRRMFRFLLTRFSEVEPDLELDESARFEMLLRRMVDAYGLPWVWGAGAGGKRVAAKLDQAGIPWHGFIDSDETKRDTLIEGRPVKSAEVLVKTDPIIVASVSATEICERLVETGRIEGEDFLVAPLNAPTPKLD